MEVRYPTTMLNIQEYMFNSMCIELKKECNSACANPLRCFENHLLHCADRQRKYFCTSIHHGITSALITAALTIWQKQQ